MFDFFVHMFYCMYNGNTSFFCNFYNRLSPFMANSRPKVSLNVSYSSTATTYVVSVIYLLVRMVVLYCTEDLVLCKESSVFGCYMYMPTILANPMQEKQSRQWPFLYSSENRNRYWTAWLWVQIFRCRTNQLSWGSLDGSAGIYSIDSVADMIYISNSV